MSYYAIEPYTGKILIHASKENKYANKKIKSPSNASYYNKNNPSETYEEYLEKEKERKRLIKEGKDRAIKEKRDYITKLKESGEWDKMKKEREKQLQENIKNTFFPFKRK